MPRDRNATRARILAATELLIARGGVPTARINAIATAAGVDKVLIYRYFGGRAQLLRALARERRLWPAADLGAGAGAEHASLAGALAAAVIAAARALRANPLARRAASWALTEHDEFAREVAAARDEELRALASALRARYRVPPFADLDALIALLTAAMTHLALHAGGASANGFAWLELRRDDDWRRAERALTGAVNALLAVDDG
jgi:AcrR family transcriptional regulator